MIIFRLFIAFTLICFALSPSARGVVPPPPGGYPNFTTAAGDHALQALTLGLGNTAIGTFSLFSNTTGSFNTAVGAGSLDLNIADSNTATGAAALLVNTGNYYVVVVDADGKLGTFLVDANGNKATVPSPLGLQQQAMLNRKVEEQQATIAELKSTVAQQQKAMEVLTAQLKEQASQIQKVSAQVEMIKPAPQVVVNKP